MISRMATVRVAKAVKMKNSRNPPARLRTFRPMWITMVQSTSESSAEGETQGTAELSKREDETFAFRSATVNLESSLKTVFLFLFFYSDF